MVGISTALTFSRERMNRPVVPSGQFRFTQHDPGWALQYAHFAQQLQRHPWQKRLVVHHIGSTAVPGLSAKAVIDVMPVYESAVDLDLLSTVLQSMSFQCWGAHGLPGRVFFTLEQDGYRTMNVHAYPTGHPDIGRHLGFRDLLRADPVLRGEYAALKQWAFALNGNDMMAYGSTKKPWVDHIEQRALAAGYGKPPFADPPSTP